MKTVVVAIAMFMAGAYCGYRSAHPSLLLPVDVTGAVPHSLGVTTITFTDAKGQSVEFSSDGSITGTAMSSKETGLVVFSGLQDTITSYEQRIKQTERVCSGVRAQIPLHIPRYTLYRNKL